MTAEDATDAAADQEPPTPMSPRVKLAAVLVVLLLLAEIAIALFAA